LLDLALVYSAQQLPAASRVGETIVGGIDLNKARMRRVIEALLALSSSPARRTRRGGYMEAGRVSGLLAPPVAVNLPERKICSPTPVE
jgi:hypothetical protein